MHLNVPLHGLQNNFMVWIEIQGSKARHHTQAHTSKHKLVYTHLLPSFGAAPFHGHALPDPVLAKTEAVIQLHERVQTAPTHYNWQRLF